MAGRYLGNKIVSVVRKKELGIIAREISKSTVQSTSYDTRKAMDFAYDSVSQTVNLRKLNSDNLLVLGESIGCCHASRFAAEFGVKRLILALPGSKLAECIFESHTTRPEARQARENGYTLEDYQNELPRYNPLAYVPRISGRVVIPLATHDIMIPAHRGKQLIDAFTVKSGRRGDLQVAPYIYCYCDHTSGAVRFAWNFESILEKLL